MKLKKILHPPKEKILVIGSKGMLGKQVYKYFQNKNYSVFKIDKKINYRNVDAFIQEINLKKKTIIINCIGKIRQKEKNPEKIIFINSIFPYKLTNLLNKKHLLVHPSTDCVFSGKKSGYYKLHSQ